MVEAGDERLLRRRIAAAGALELDSERLQPPNRGKQVVHEGLHEHGIGDAAAHVADGLCELSGIRLVLGRDEPESPGPWKEARAREEGALARYSHARAGLAGLDGRDDAGDAGTDDQHVAGADGDFFGIWIRPAVALPGHVRAFLEGDETSIGEAPPFVSGAADRTRLHSGIQQAYVYPDVPGGPYEDQVL